MSKHENKNCTSAFFALNKKIHCQEARYLGFSLVQTLECMCGDRTANSLVLHVDVCLPGPARYSERCIKSGATVRATRFLSVALTYRQGLVAQRSVARLRN